MTSHGAPEPGCGTKLGAQGGQRKRRRGAFHRVRAKGNVSVFICEPCVFVTAGLRCVSRCL